MSEFYMFFQSFDSRVGFVTVFLFTFELQISNMNWKMIFQVIFVVELLATGGTEVLFSISLIVNISQMFQQIVSQ